jgi:hypothetical protein
MLKTFISQPIYVDSRKMAREIEESKVILSSSFSIEDEAAVGKQ